MQRNQSNDREFAEFPFLPLFYVLILLCRGNNSVRWARIRYPRISGQIVD